MRAGGGARARDPGRPRCGGAGGGGPDPPGETGRGRHGDTVRRAGARSRGRPLPPGPQPACQRMHARRRTDRGVETSRQGDDVVLVVADDWRGGPGGPPRQGLREVLPRLDEARHPRGRRWQRARAGSIVAARSPPGTVAPARSPTAAGAHGSCSGSPASSTEASLRPVGPNLGCTVGISDPADAKERLVAHCADGQDDCTADPAASATRAVTSVQAGCTRTWTRCTRATRCGGARTSWRTGCDRCRRERRT